MLNVCDASKNNIKSKNNIDVMTKINNDVMSKIMFENAQHQASRIETIMFDVSVSQNSD